LGKGGGLLGKSGWENIEMAKYKGSCMSIKEHYKTEFKMVFLVNSGKTGLTNTG
jgi:hypothetical protein